MKYRKKPIEVEAFQWNGNMNELLKWANSTQLLSTYSFKQKTGFFGYNVLEIKTNKGKMTAALGDIIIKGIRGEFYPVKPDIFRDTYERIG